MTVSKQRLINIYNKLYRIYGPQYWWPGETKFEVIVGAILTQNTNWVNVEKAINNLKKEKKLNPKKLNSIHHKTLAKLIKPAGYYNIKTKRLKSFLKYLFKYYDGSVKKMFRNELNVLRKELLGINGIGPETADSILLYAGNYPIFVVDAYTKRIFSRHELFSKDGEYHEVQKYFMDRLKHDVKLFNEYHALIVRIGKDYCKSKKPLCERCVLYEGKKTNSK